MGECARIHRLPNDSRETSNVFFLHNAAFPSSMLVVQPELSMTARNCIGGPAGRVGG